MEKANLCHADLRGADFRKADFREADLGDANLAGANLEQAQLVMSNLENADLTDCLIYGISAWGVNLEGATQTNLMIARPDAPTISVDNLEVAQFIDLLLNNQKIRRVIDTITSKVVLILGRFTPERKAVLDALREELPNRDYLPVLFDFDKQGSKNVTGIVETLARMAKFIIVDLKDPSSVPHGLATVVPFLRTTPVLPLRLRGATGYSMFEDLWAYPWVLATYYYEDAGSLTTAIAEIISAAERSRPS